MLKAQKRITRKELKHDPLMDTLYRLRGGWRAHKRRLSRYGGIALVLVVVSVVVRRCQSAQDEKAAAAVGIAFVEYGQGNYHTVIAQLDPRVEEYSGLKSFGTGLYLLARSELMVSDTIGAEIHYRLYLDEYGKDPLVKAGSLAGLGVIAEGREDYEAAAQLFSEASGHSPTASLRRRYAIFSGHNFLLSHEPHRALAILRPLLEEELDFQTGNEVGELVSAAEAQIRTSGGT